MIHHHFHCDLSMTEAQSREFTYTALAEACVALRLTPLSPHVAQGVEHYGIEALIECTLAAQPATANAALRAHFYAAVLDRLSHLIARELSASLLCA
jgi:hypothetical protein